MTAILYVIGIHLAFGILAWIIVATHEVRRRRAFRAQYQMKVEGPSWWSVARDMAFLVPCGVIAFAALPRIFADRR